MSVNLSSVFGAGAQLFSDQGVILAGGLLYTYVAGTTTPQATYTDNSGTTPNANPIVLTSAGRTPYEIWLTAGVQYKFVLKTSAGVTIANGTWDNIGGINDIVTGSAVSAASSLTANNILVGNGGAQIQSSLYTLPPAASGQVGYINIPINSQSANYTTTLTDQNGCVYHPSTDANARTFTIAANASVAYAIGTCITFVNMTSQVVTIAINSDTLYLSGTGSTGTRSIAQYGCVTALKLEATKWIISGQGIS